MTDPWAHVAAACLPAAGLAALAPVRCRPDVAVSDPDGTPWVTFPAGDPGRLRHLRPVTGVTFFARSGGHWFPFGRRLPTVDGPPAGGESLDRVVVPDRIVATGPPPGVAVPVRVGIVRGGVPVAATALRCAVAA